ncbi:MAG: 1-acyl-sn-glycerol-3-phosphate acyltransferase [Chloroflexota bacterium]
MTQAQTTSSDTDRRAPRPSPILRYASKFIIWVIGWRIDPASDEPYNYPSYVMISAPHTSNWDGFFSVVAFWAADIRVATFLKQEMLDIPVIGHFLRWVGFIGIDRARPTRSIMQVVRQMRKESLIVVIAPEGTRQKATGWKPGFYYIAQKAKVPILLSLIDYEKKVCTISKRVVHPAGDMEAEIEGWRAEIEATTPKHPERTSPIVFDMDATEP